MRALVNRRVLMRMRFAVGKVSGSRTSSRARGERVPHLAVREDLNALSRHECQDPMARSMSSLSPAPDSASRAGYGVRRWRSSQRAGLARM